MKCDRVCAREVQLTTSAETEVGSPCTVDNCITITHLRTTAAFEKKEMRKIVSVPH